MTTYLGLNISKILKKHKAKNYCRKQIEFDGYFQERWEDAADTIVNFDEDYFENRDRKNLYVFLSALYDDEVFDYLQSAYAIAKLEAPTKEWVKLDVDGLISEGVRF